MLNLQSTLRRNAISLAAVAALALSAGGVVATAEAQPAAGVRATDVPLLRVDPYDRVFHLRPTDSPRMHKAWHAWKRLEDKRYDTVIHRLCFCAPRKPVVTEIRGGAIDSVTRADDPARPIPRSGWTMDRFFFMLRHAYATADSVSVHFGRQGVPRSIAIDPDKLTIDEEQYYRIHIDRR